ncbi:CHAT domain-containing protein [Kitasatospora sp. NBC_00240]|uniref:CHAT domain-containing protein n=1 Tax=Kitasatospora sp. NBC_00240 TaxID=2903567 RepID=UPI00225A61C9|nr:CHAT domain-containing protein [Kitasatospora sp. NBC_00240]MCX5215735.1 CHAT domain-containing protein [Kitasatospora sp. NBC_00240]
MALAREWDDLVEQVRKLEGFEDFLRPPRLDSLLPVASDGPVVVVNVSQWSCDALIVTKEGVRNRKLPDLTLGQATERADTYLRTLQDAERAGHDHLMARDAVDAAATPAAIRAQGLAAAALMKAEHSTDDMLRSLQGWLWDCIAEPVLDELGLDQVPPTGTPWPRLWWCPTGPLTLLPVHTAGHHGEAAGDGAPRSVLDRVVSSYTPTLRALLEARSVRVSADRMARDGDTSRADFGGADGDRMLVVAVGDVPGQPPLYNVAAERDVLTALFPPGRRTLLEGPEATRRAVDEQLTRHRWVHFSCHGDQDLADPSRGGLLLYDGMLTISDISARQFRGDFAGLSACKTAVGGINLPDEAVTLAAALHYTGYRHVVAALWSVDDSTAAQVFSAVYGEITNEGRLRPEAAASALHNVVRALRDEAPDEPRIWTPFTHIGP